MKFNKGFTLIELLVVIAIIGILASIILVSLGGARSKGNDASIQETLHTVQTQAEIYASNNPATGYGTQAAATASAGASCGAAGMWTDTTIAAATKSASSAGGVATLNAVTSKTTYCVSSSNAYMFAVVLNSDVTKAWCVDSNGLAKVSTVSNITSSPTTCPN